LPAQAGPPFVTISSVGTEVGAPLVAVVCGINLLGVLVNEEVAAEVERLALDGLGSRLAAILGYRLSSL
jgi:hypothetical protein